MQKIVLFSSFLLCLTGMASIVAGESPSSSGSSFSPVSLTLTGKNPKKTRGKAGFFLAKDENGADFYVCVTSQVITYKTETSEWKELPGQTSLNISDQADSSNWQQLEVIQNRVQAAHAGDSLRERQASPSIAQLAASGSSQPAAESMTSSPVHSMSSKQHVTHAQERNTPTWRKLLLGTLAGGTVLGGGYCAYRAVQRPSSEQDKTNIGSSWVGFFKSFSPLWTVTRGGASLSVAWLTKRLCAFSKKPSNKQAS